MTNTLKQLAAAGTSPWLDNIRRGWLVSGEFRRMVDEGVVGVTSNPTIFQKAIADSTDYDSAVAALRRRGSADGRVLRARDRGRARRGRPDPARLRRHRPPRRVRLVRAAAGAWPTTRRRRSRRRREFFGRIGRPNIFIKIPGTAEGVPAIEETIAAGINVNVTLLFSLSKLRGHPRGVHPRPRAAASRAGEPIVGRRTRWRASSSAGSTPRSTAQLPEGSPLRGKAAVANAKLAYQRFRRDHRRPIAGRRWPRRAPRCSGRCGRRPATKNPAYSDVLYVDELIGPDCVNTMPEGTIAAFLDHGTRAPHGRRRRRRRAPAARAGRGGGREHRRGHRASSRPTASSRSRTRSTR